jgi:hypothetical protein
MHTDNLMSEVYLNLARYLVMIPRVCRHSPVMNRVRCMPLVHVAHTVFIRLYLGETHWVWVGSTNGHGV